MLYDSQCVYNLLDYLFFTAKKGKKGKTMALTDFLSDEAGNQTGPGTSYVYSAKTTDWATEMENADFGGKAIPDFVMK